MNNPPGPTRVLMIEDSAGDVRLVREVLRDQDLHAIELVHVECLADAEAFIASHTVDVILLDLGLPDAEGLDAVRQARGFAPRVPIMVLTGVDDDVLAVQALQEGAQDFLVKGQLEIRGLLRALRYAIERKSMEDALFFEKERAQLTLNCMGDGVICTDPHGQITFVNVVAEAMTGWSSHHATGRPLTEVYRMRDGELSEPRPGQLPSSCTLVRRDGFEIPSENSIAPIHDRAGLFTGSVIVLRDVSEVRAMSLEMTHSAQHDGLTGLPNRMLLKDRVDQAIVLAQRYKRRVALLYLDLDGFKYINDSLGHAVGDRLLKSVASRLLDCARASDTVSRQGGDEFVILLSEVQHIEDAAIAARRMLRSVAEAHAIDPHELHVTTSIGISVFPEDGLDAETLVSNADTAMYQAKEHGRHSFQYFEPVMNERAVDRQMVEAALRRALERDELSLHYQPKIDFRSGAIIGAEALLRWTHPTRGSMAPAMFIPVAEDTGLIKPIGSWVLRQACLQARAWIDAGLPESTIAVNVSAIEFRDEGFLEGLYETLHETGLDPRLLELELTESVLMKNAVATAAILHAVRKIGVQVAVDDFGTGYSSLSYLHRFPVDALKIDRSFVAQITSAEEDVGIVTAVISMARSLKLRVVAEGVETLAQLRFLRAQECDQAQGYYFSRPVVANQYAQLLQAGGRQPLSVAS
ncbi:MAG: EAL domain-containing protein [Kofleriaceae bacterium]